MVSAARSLMRPRSATCSDLTDAPEKRKVGGSTPPLTTIQLATAEALTSANTDWTFPASHSRVSVIGPT